MFDQYFEEMTIARMTLEEEEIKRYRQMYNKKDMSKYSIIKKMSEPHNLYFFYKDKPIFDIINIYKESKEPGFICGYNWKAVRHYKDK